MRSLCEPAFWAGFDRSSADGFHDYFRQLTEYEPKRAARFGIRHFCWLCINPKEADDPGFAREVMALIPDFIEKENVLGIGEIGLNKNTRSELKIFEEHVQIALDHDLPILIHTPHLEDKLKGTKLIIDSLASFSKLDRSKVIIDHVEEHTVKEVVAAGFWAGMTLYPESKCTPNRAIDILETHEGSRLWLNSACDWGVSDPLAVVKCGFEKGDIRARDVEISGGGSAFTIVTEEGGEVRASISVPGRHMVSNALLAAAVGLHFGLSLEQVARGLAAAELTGGALVFECEGAGKIEQFIDGIHPDNSGLLEDGIVDRFCFGQWRVQSTRVSGAY